LVDEQGAIAELMYYKACVLLEAGAAASLAIEVNVAILTGEALSRLP